LRKRGSGGAGSDVVLVRKPIVAHPLQAARHVIGDTLIELIDDRGERLS
jgi:hypothetical protein